MKTLFCSQELWDLVENGFKIQHIKQYISLAYSAFKFVSKLGCGRVDLGFGRAKSSCGREESVLVFLMLNAKVKHLIFCANGDVIAASNM